MQQPSFIESLKTELRISGRILQETFGGIRRTGWMNLVIVVTMASILSIFGILFAVVMESQIFVHHLGSSLEISAYAKPDADVTELARTIQGLPHVSRVEVVKKDTAWEDMKQMYDVPEIENPLPDTLHVTVDSQSYIRDTAKQLRELPLVENVNDGHQVLDLIEKLSKGVTIVGLVVSLFFGTLTMFVISNTIQLLIQARGREIEILRMMGVGNWYIRLPFLFQGSFYGLMGALLAFVPLALAEFYIFELFKFFQFGASGYSLTVVSGVMMLMGVLVGGGGASVSVHRYLRT
ncbi:MAG: permease-like cell division protein FtsX [Candidatus Melainabacteria bacterium]|nr:permease-like cell division protein FtsX [Candidatus Melainabacteria bacterium]